MVMVWHHMEWHHLQRMLWHDRKLQASVWLCHRHTLLASWRQMVGVSQSSGRHMQRSCGQQRSWEWSTSGGRLQRLAGEATVCKALIPCFGHLDECFTRVTHIIAGADPGGHTADPTVGIQTSAQKQAPEAAQAPCTKRQHDAAEGDGITATASVAGRMSPVEHQHCLWQTVM